MVPLPPAPPRLIGPAGAGQDEGDDDDDEDDDAEAVEQRMGFVSRFSIVSETVSPFLCLCSSELS